MGKKLFRRTAAAALSFLFVLTAVPAPVFASEGAEEEQTQQTVAAGENAAVDLKAKSGILMEATTGKVLYESNADEAMPPASVTKVMTLLLVMEALDDGKITMEQNVSASEHACSMGGSQIWLEPGEEMTVHELLKAAAISSANDASMALAELVAGSEETFVAMMNDRAKELGMENTNFVNPTGLDAQGHVTTARDIALMSRELIKHEKIFEYSTVWMDTLRGGKTSLVNTNKLIRFYDGATGLKTGTTSGAGYCLSATARRNGLSLVSVVMGAENSPDRFESAKTLLNYGFANWAVAKIDVGDTFDPVKVIKGVKESVPIEAENPGAILVKKGLENSIEKKIELSPDVAAPVVKGQTLGKVVLMLEGEELESYPLKAAEDVGELTFFEAFKKMMGALVSMK